MTKLWTSIGLKSHLAIHTNALRLKGFIFFKAMQPKSNAFKMSHTLSFSDQYFFHYSPQSRTCSEGRTQRIPHYRIAHGLTVGSLLSQVTGMDLDFPSK